MSFVLCKSDPWAGARCGREGCFPCSSAGEGKGGKCYTENILYKLTCMECKAVDVTSTYIGESSRSGSERAKEHIGGQRRKDPKNPMYSHGADYHASLQGEPTYTMEIMRSFRTPLSRLIAEAVEIERGEADVVINA